jgi:hypothetical protein
MRKMIFALCGHAPSVTGNTTVIDYAIEVRKSVEIKDSDPLDYRTLSQ